MNSGIGNEIRVQDLVYVLSLTGGNLVPGSWLTKIIFPFSLISVSGPLDSPGSYRNGILQFTGELWEHGSGPISVWNIHLGSDNYHSVTVFSFNIAPPLS